MKKLSRNSNVIELVDARGIPKEVDLQELKSAVEHYRGSRIEFVESPNLDGVRICGAWTGDGNGLDTIHLPQGARPEMKLFVACHEFGHMLDMPIGAEHVAPIPAPDIEAFIASVMNPERRVAFAYARSSFNDEREARAEAIGDQLALRIFRAARRRVDRDFNFQSVFG